MTWMKAGEVFFSFRSLILNVLDVEFGSSANERYEKRFLVCEKD